MRQGDVLPTVALIDVVDEASIESFPASDAPAWTIVYSPGAPARPAEQAKRPGEGGIMPKDALIAGLNEDLAGELGTIIRYTYQAGRAEGPIGEHIRDMLRREVSDELSHATFLTDVIVDLGGEPTTAPLDFDKPGSLKAMLELDLAMEQADVTRYTKHAGLAEELDLVELRLKLEEIAADEARHARQIRRILRGI